MTNIQYPLPEPAKHLSPEQAEALEVHNEARKAASQHSSVPRPALIWDPHLVAEAEKWAEHLAQQDAGLKHSTGEQRSGQGENLYWMSSGGSLAGASRSWVDERKAYHGEKIGAGRLDAYGHYTQVIWPSTTIVGIASAKSSNGGIFIVGRYSPPGNFTGENAFTGR